LSIQILGGHAKGHALFVPKGDSTRPTTVMLRRKFFDAHQDCSKMTFVDLCAGTGAMGLEAASRGAKEVFLVENNKHAFMNLKKNVKQVIPKLPAIKIHTENLDAVKYLKHFLIRAQELDEDELSSLNLFFDPPYERKDLYEKVLTELKNSNFQGKFWLESDRQKGLKVDDLTEKGFEIEKLYKQGTSYIAKISF
jgi:16S rRNA (guanine966-N2)-methyltransferase